MESEKKEDLRQKLKLKLQGKKLSRSTNIAKENYKEKLLKIIKKASDDNK